MNKNNFIKSSDINKNRQNPRKVDYNLNIRNITNLTKEQAVITIQRRYRAFIKVILT